MKIKLTDTCGGLKPIGQGFARSKKCWVLQGTQHTLGLQGTQYMLGPCKGPLQGPNVLKINQKGTLKNNIEQNLLI